MKPVLEKKTQAAPAEVPEPAVDVLTAIKRVKKRKSPMPRISWHLVHWPNTLFLMGTLLVTLIGVPIYLWNYGLNAFQVTLFLVFFMSTGISITLGYHRLFSHLSFKATWPVRLLTLLFGAAAFENSALCWAADHRRHHKFVDHEEDPYDISKGFFHAHMGWILFRLQEDSPLDFVRDLEEQPLVSWQNRHYRTIAIMMGLVLPTVIGWCWGGWSAALGGFLMAGVARVVAVHHMTFLINSLCHTLGNRPYSTRCTARDSSLMAFFTFGEGYHNFHHEFQHDYRNGVKFWHFDPTKWCIWLLHQLGLVAQLRRVPAEKIMMAEVAEQQRQLTAILDARPVPLAENIHRLLRTAQEQLHQASLNWERRKEAYAQAAERKVEASRQRIAELRREFREAAKNLHAAVRQWRETHQLVQAALA